MDTYLDPNKSLDEHKFIAEYLRDVQNVHGGVYTPRDMKLDLRKIQHRLSREGISFLTKTLPRLGKAFKRALSGEVSLDATGFRKIPGSQIPRFLGGLFKSVFTLDGWVLPHPCVDCIATLIGVFELWYKLELPYDKEQEQEVIEKFERTEDEILDISLRLSAIAEGLSCDNPLGRQSHDRLPKGQVIARARARVNRVFRSLNTMDIYPSHGPGAVSTGEKLWNKWRWTTISPRITQSYPIDEYFYSSLSAVCDNVQSIQSLNINESSARVVLVPKDSRGPRLISCEPLDFQWIQQGLSRAIVKRLEHHPLTRHNVFFTNQLPNQLGALLGSKDGRYVTLDLAEASDRITVGLVHLLFGGTGLLDPLLNCRSLSTELPGGKILYLNKYAPMGSALCFPVLATCVWAILSAGAPDADTRKSILVYGDDVIVPKAYALNAIELLESFGLKVNREKSCISGFFRESCGTEAFRGQVVTPVRFRTVWSSSRCPHSYTSWVAYANSMYDKKYFHSYWYIVEKLIKVYGSIPDQASFRGCPVLREVPEYYRPKTKRLNVALQRAESKVWVLQPIVVQREIDGHAMLLRYFSEGRRGQSRVHDNTGHHSRCCGLPYEMNGSILDTLLVQGLLEKEGLLVPFSVRRYTKRKQVRLVQRWVEYNPTGTFMPERTIDLSLPRLACKRGDDKSRQ